MTSKTQASIDLELLKRIEEYLMAYDDRGPHGEGWQSRQLEEDHDSVLEIIDQGATK